MQKILICSLCMIAGLAGSGYAAKERSGHLHTPSIPTGPRIRVLLEKDANSAVLEAKGPYKVIRRDSNTLLSGGNTGKRFVVHALQDGLRWGEEYPDVYQITVIPASYDTTFFVNGIQYKGNISIYHARNNKIAIVNEVAIEDYVKSSLAVKSDEAESKEALAALAILERTEALGRAAIGKASGRPWDVTSHDAKYFGYGVTFQTKKIEEVVEGTRFMVLESKQESEKNGNWHLDPSKAEELACQGYDAKKILTSSFSQVKLGLTINPEEIAVR